MKGSVGVSTTYQDIFYGTALYNPKMIKQIRSIMAFSSSNVAQFRLKVIEFHEKYGTRATIDAFTVSKPTIYTAGEKHLKIQGVFLKA